MVEELLTRDAVVRVMVRSADAQVPAYPEKVVADVDDPGSLRPSLEGVRRAYLVTPSSERAERQQLDFVDAARPASNGWSCCRSWAASPTLPSGSCATTPPWSSTCATAGWTSRSCGPTCTSRACSRCPSASSATECSP